MAVDLSTSYRAPAVARRMADAARRFLDSLPDRKRAAATFPFPGDERYRWDYRPVNRNGLRLISMTAEQKALALALVETGLSARGTTAVKEIVELEEILRDVERLENRVHPWVRDHELYYFSVFGEPGGADPWAWRVGGHHVGLHFAIVDRDQVAPLPCFFGANPARVPFGPREGFRTLPGEEDLARALVLSLDPAQRQRAIFQPVAPADIITDNYRSALPGVLPCGLPYAELSGQHRQMLVDLIRHYVDRAADDLARIEWSRIEQAGLERVEFAWAGPPEQGHKHYYAVKGPTFMIEYDNTQNDANHIHSVIRDFTNDWGEDLLAEHYKASHRH